MKKATFLLAIIMMLGMFSACQGTRTPLDAAGFIEKAEAAGYTLQIVPTVDDETEAYLIAFRDEDMLVLCQFEFIVQETTAQIVEAYQLILDTIEENKPRASSYSTASTGGYAYYKLTTEDVYSVVSRIDNTLVYVYALIDCKAEAEAFLKELGY